MAGVTVYEPALPTPRFQMYGLYIQETIISVTAALDASADAPNKGITTEPLF